MSGELFYFGCIGSPGHDYWQFRDGRPVSVTYKSKPPGPWGNGIDSKDISPAVGNQGDAYMHYKDGWTALAIVDRTGDSRPNSRSVFLTEGNLSFAAMLMLVVDECDLLDRIGEVREASS